MGLVEIFAVLSPSLQLSIKIKNSLLSWVERLKNFNDRRLYRRLIQKIV